MILNFDVEESYGRISFGICIGCISSGDNVVVKGQKSAEERCSRLFECSREYFPKRYGSFHTLAPIYYAVSFAYTIWFDMVEPEEGKEVSIFRERFRFTKYVLGLIPVFEGIFELVLE